MRQSKEKKPVRGFKRSFRAGIAIILLLSLILTWGSLRIIRAFEGTPDPTSKSIQETGKDSVRVVYVDRIKEIKVTDTLYLRPPALKAKTEVPSVEKKDSISK